MRGVTYLVVVKYWFTEEELMKVRQRDQVVLDLPRFLVLRLS